MTRNKDKKIFDSIKAMRKNYKNVYESICRYLVESWNDDWEYVLFEYEQFFEIQELDQDVSLEKKSLYCLLYKEILSHETEEKLSELMQLYTDAGAYNKAAKVLDRLNCLQKKEKYIVMPGVEAFLEKDDVDVKGDQQFVHAFLQIFGGREDIYGREELNYGKRRCIKQIPEPLTEEVIKRHLDGRYTVSTYIQRPNHTVKYLIIDLDISKKHLLQEGVETALYQYLPEAGRAAQEMLKILRGLGLRGYLEYSGYRGYHIWIFFTEWIPTRYVTMLAERIDYLWNEKIPDITVEYFPNKGRMRNGSVGQSLKMPYGVHIKTGKRSMLLTDEFQKVQPDYMYLSNIEQFSLQAIKRIVEGDTQDIERGEQKEADTNLEAFGELEESIKIVLEKCSLMRYLCQKARTTGYLSHFERLSILYVFGHIGEEGKNFVHTIMEFTLNYQYHVTDKFIQKLPAKPISCLKLRDQYKQITAEYGCSCNFKRTKNCYPSPVLHAIKTSEDMTGNVTIPTSRTLSKEGEKRAVEEINIPFKVQALAGKVIEMKKQKRGIDKAIQKAETELGKIFDLAGIDCLEVDMGLLVRRKCKEGTEWVIEI